ncbi:PREDICTED: uncharacterized protein LOC104704229 [Camelina sativa]|uniref:Uncharacterized protein LOC104704229 n=1 Tax=Camelina sativa TaxID=90675 RepID=A0ABM0T019_CAMSA|nr:PREDICTED: uncharacterized protein LOC104704229 [Camelina sativa]
MVSCLVKLPFITKELVVSIVYASSTSSDYRKELWTELQEFAVSPHCLNKPWLVLGDFNQILYPHEHSNPSFVTSTRGMRDLSQCLLNSGLSDLPYHGNTFTWSNKHEVDPIAKKLDRILMNDVWFQEHPLSLGVFGEPGFSDHSPCCVFLDTMKPKPRKPSKFLSLLNNNPEFANLLSTWWNAVTYDCSKMLNVSKKLKELKSIIKDFSKLNYSNLEMRTAEAYEELLSSQQILLSTNSPQVVQLEKEAHTKWSTLAKVEESYLLQKSRICWLEDGDRNSKFFYLVVASRLAQNQILYLLDEQDQIVDSEQGIRKLAVDFYTRLLGSKGYSRPSMVEEIQGILPQRCSEAVVQLLDSRVTAEDIKTVLFSLPTNKSPGPDGYCAEFFTAKWSIVGKDIVAAVTEFFTTVPNASKMTDFRPISCCNTIYKVISKILAQRLKAVLLELISNTQSAFISGRLLVKNVLLATELVQGYNQVNISERGMLKVDLKKAFDSEPKDYDKVTQCPLIYLLSQWSYQLSPAEFTHISGLEMNRAKTDLFLDGVNHLESNQIASLGFNLGSLPIRYLGLPLMHRKLRIADYRPLIESVTAKFSSWSVRALSYAGRKELISTVIYGTVTFWVSAFILPKGCLKTIESLCSRFLWNGDITRKANAKVSWTTLCLPKEDGVLRFWDFSQWNRNLMLKLIWRLFSARDSLLAEWIRNNKIKDAVFWSNDEKKPNSWTWKSLLHLRPLAIQFIRCKLGSGTTASFWYNWWTPLGPLIRLFGHSGPSQTGIPLTGSVAQACSSSGWCLRPARSPQAELLHIQLSTITEPTSTSEEDSFVWSIEDTKYDCFNTKKTWETIRHMQHPLPWTPHVWYRGAVLRHAFLMWLTHLDRLPTRTRLASWGMQVDTTACCVCDTHPEIRDHLFLHCDVSEDIWLEVTRRLGYSPFVFHTWDAFSA